MTQSTTEKLRKGVSHINNIHISKLKKNLQSLCRDSRWKDIGHSNLILNISTTPLKQYELEVLQFGLKFAMGLCKRYELLDIVNTNYRHIDSDFNITSTTNNHTPTHNLPRRYITAHTNLTKNKNILITFPHKSGRIAILDTVDYHKKLMTQLNDQNTYTSQPLLTTSIKTEIFNKSYKKIISNYGLH